MATRTARFACLATLLALAAAGALPSAVASHSTPPGDALHVAVDVAGAIFHDPFGMCHWSGCPWPWTVPGNFVGSCDTASGADWWITTCDGVWQELYFDVQVPGGGFGLTRLGNPVDFVAFHDSLGLGQSRGVVAVFCGPEPEPEGPNCVTNVSVSSLLAEVWRGTA